MASKKRDAAIRELAKKMRGIDFCMMSTVAKNAIHSRPMSNNGQVDFDGDCWFFSWRDSNKVREIEKNPQVSLAYTGGTPKKPLWIQLEGRAKIVTSAARKKEHWTKGLERWFEDGPEDADVVLLHVRATRAEWWSFEEEGDVKL